MIKIINYNLSLCVRLLSFDVFKVLFCIPCRLSMEKNDEELMVPYITITELRRSPYYSTYYINLAALLVLGVIPVFLLTYFNCVIYFKIKPSPVLFQQNEISGSTSRISRYTNQEKDLAKVLIGIVIMFIVCHTLRLLINFYETIVIRDAIACESAGKNDFPLWGFITITFSELLLVINSSVNMIIYCCLNGNFRKRVLSWKNHLRPEVTTTRETRMAKTKVLEMNHMPRLSISSGGIIQ